MSEKIECPIVTTIESRLDTMDARLCSLATRAEVKELSANIRTAVWSFVLLLAAAVVAAALK